MKMEKRWMTLPETAKYLGFAESTLYHKMMPEHKGPELPVKPKKFGGKILFDRYEIDAYLENY